ncbi:hypothetical protein JCM3774_004002 [Rhodotorula dairenensis]
MSGIRNTSSPHVYGGSSQLRGNTSSSNAGPSSRATGVAPQTPSTGAGAPSGPAGEDPSVRYARLSQRKKDAGGNAYPPPPPIGSYAGLQNTSVNIANAFKAATSGRGSVVTGGRREDFPEPAGEGKEYEEEADAEENHAEPEDEDLYEDEAPATGQSGVPGKAPSSAGRKRKKHGNRDPTCQDQPGQSSSSDDSEYDQLRGQKKRTKVHSDDNDHVDDPAALNKPRRRSHKPVDPTYRPSSDPNFRAGQTTTSDSEAGAPKRRRSKGKGRSSTGGRSLASEAIPRGIKDSQVWHDKKRKAKRGSRKSAAGVEGGEPDDHSTEDYDEEEDDDEEDAGHDAEGRDLGGMDPSGHLGAHEDEDAEDGDETPPAATYFLRLRSPSPPAGQGGGTSKDRSTIASGPQTSNVGASTSRQSVDPAFAAFDRSLSGTGQDSNSLTASIDDSVLRGSSYDYSEEERIVQALEAQKRQRIERQQQQQQQQQQQGSPPQPRQSRVSHQPTPRGAPNPATPIISNGGYPATPNAGPVSPVTAFRKRRLPGPPSMLGAGTPLGAPADDGLDDLARAEKLGGQWGRRCGNALRPLVRFAGGLWRRTQDPLLNWPRILKAITATLLALSLLVAVIYYDLVPMPARPGPSTPYVPPSAPPDSLEGVISRLADLEAAMGRLSSASGVDRQQAAANRQATRELQHQFRELEYGLKMEQTRSRETIDAIDRANAKQAKEAERAVGAVKTEMGDLKSKLEQAIEAQRADGTSLRVLQHEAADLTSQLGTVQSQVAEAARAAALAADDDRVTKLALEAIGKKLPGKIGVWMDESGRLDIDPSFWRVLKDVFVDKKAVEKAVDAKLGALEASKRSGLFGSSKEGKAPAAAKPSVPTWDAFIAENEDALRAWVASDLSSRTGNEAFVSKRTFLDLLDRKLKSVQRDFNEKVNDNFEQMGQEILAKVAKQDEMRRKEASSHGGLHLNPFARHGHAGDAPASGGGSITIKGSDGQNVTAVISSLVDSALLRYSKDVLARPDYALYTSGARVIRSLTSPSYEPFRLGRVRSTMAWISGAAVPQSRPPVTALHPDTSPGSCWPFAGPHGQLGIQLSRRVVPTDITLEHISRDVALDGDVSSAPKDFEVWGIVETAEDVAKVAKYRHEQLEAKRAARAAGSTLEDDLESTPASVPESANHLLLASGAYDPAKSSPVQTFPVTLAARQLGVPVQVVVVKILSNHGESSYTCLYRVRVSGTTEAQLDAGTATRSA